jgi:hypothetical protein
MRQLGIHLVALQQVSCCNENGSFQSSGGALRERASARLSERTRHSMVRRN